MSTPIYDILSVKHSRNIGDAVASATTDGSSVTSAQRDTHLNNAIRRFLRYKYDKKDFACINPYINDSPSTVMVGNLFSLSSLSPACAWVINVTNTKLGTYRQVKEVPQELANYFGLNVSGTADDTNSFLKASGTNQLYVRQGSNLRVYGSGATDPLIVRYVAQHTSLIADSGSDILIDSQYFDILLEMALQEFYADFPTEVNALRLKSSVDRLGMILG